MKKSKALLLDELTQLDADRLTVHEAIKSHWNRPPASTNYIDVRSGPNHVHEPEVQQAIDAAKAERENTYMALLTMVNAFRTRLCTALGITDQPVGMYDDANLLDYIIINEPILGGDADVITRIDYGRANEYEWEHEQEPPYRVRMVLGSMNIEVYANNTENLLTLIDRGYTCLRILGKGTRYFHYGR